MTDTAGAHPPGGSPAGADLPGATGAGAPSDPTEGDVFVSLVVKVAFPASWKGAREHIGDTLLPMLRTDSGRFESIGGDGQAGEGPPVKSPWGAMETETVGRARLRQGTLFRHEIVADHPDSRVTVVTSHEILGEGADLRAAAREHGLRLLRAHLAAARECADPRLQVSLHTWFLGDTGGEMLCHLLRDPGRDLPLLVLTDLPVYPVFFFGWAESDLIGRAIVAMLDDGAASRLTDTVGKDWSCFSGSARIYRAGWSEKDRHDRHPIWRRRKILPEGHDEDFAECAFRDEVLREMSGTPRGRDRQGGADLDAHTGD